MSANKLTDTQLVLLSAAARHPEGAIEVAADIKGGAARKAVGKLLRGGFIEEIPARGALPVWRRDDDQGPLVLRITPHGLAAIGVEAERKGAPHDTELASDRPLQRVNAARRRKSRDEAPAQSAKPSSRDSKQARVVGMLQRQQVQTKTSQVRDGNRFCREYMPPEIESTNPSLGAPPDLPSAQHVQSEHHQP